MDNKEEKQHEEMIKIVLKGNPKTCAAVSGDHFNIPMW